jgi:hypothetical protein
MVKNAESDTILNDIMDTNFNPEIMATSDDFKEIDGLLALDDIEFETTELYLME